MLRIILVFLVTSVVCSRAAVLVPKPAVECLNGVWTQWFNRDRPSGYGDYETLAELRKVFTICEKPSAVQGRVKTTNVPSQFSGQTLQISPSVGLVCVNSKQSGGGCKDYEVRFCCPKPPVPECPKDGVWTPWYDRDNPSGTGDHETLAELRKKYDICGKPFAVDGRVKQNQRPYTTSGQVVSVGPTTGLVCLNKDQTNKLCLDYEVRFCCPKPVQKCPKGGVWTPWYDRDNPSGTGDHETLAELRKKYDICGKPFAVDGRVKQNQHPYTTSGQVVSVGPTTGLVCLNKDQTNKLCLDYEVRFCCPKPVPKCPGNAWTPWYDRDDPSGTGDHETLAELRKNHDICDKPFAADGRVKQNQHPYTSSGQVVSVGPTTGLVCLNKDQTNKGCLDYEVRFCCPKPPQCPKGSFWTPWYDRDNPSGTGDYETLVDLRKTYDICEKPLEVDGRLKKNQQPYYYSNEVVTINPQTGLVCRKNDQKNKICSDYEVRFCCPKAQPSCPGNNWTPWYDRDDPSATGDHETIVELRRENPGAICDKPTAVEGQRIVDSKPYQDTGEVVTASVSHGLVCLKKDQADNTCDDYRVRFCCPK